MLYKEFMLSERYPDASLTAYVCDQIPADSGISADCPCAPRPAVIVCPGGGYGYLSEREAEPIVRRFFGMGMNTYLLEYSINENAKNYAPLIEAALAIKLVRERAAEDNTDPHKVYIIGFSAGGHLAASSGILWNIPEVRKAVGVTDGSAPEGINRPDGMILSYPVITGGEYTHKGTIQRASGHVELTEEDVERFSLERHVDSTTSPAFIWHTFSDTCVPVENSLLLMQAMAKHKVPFEAHIFPEGPHGLSLCNKETWVEKEAMLVPHAETWSELAIKWIKDF